MKYKTLFRLALKVIGVFFIVQGGTSSLAYFIRYVLDSVRHGLSLSWAIQNFDARDAMYLTGPLFAVAAGCYLFFGGKWIVNKAIPSNRSYCHECGYLLKDLKGTRCPECDTPFKPDSSASS